MSWGKTSGRMVWYAGLSHVSLTVKSRVNIITRGQERERERGRGESLEERQTELIETSARMSEGGSGSGWGWEEGLVRIVWRRWWWRRCRKAYSFYQKLTYKPSQKSRLRNHLFHSCTVLQLSTDEYGVLAKLFLRFFVLYASSVHRHLCFC